MRRSVALFLRAVAGAALISPAVADDTAVTNIDHVSCTGGPNEVRIVIHNVKKSVGLMTADLYRNDSEGFLKRDGRVAQVRFAAKAPVTAFCMDAPTPDAYAIAVYHDKNANKSFDKNALGLPAEPFGLSNNPVLRMAPPKIDDTLVDVPPSGVTVDIDLKN
ncbi:MAG: DUF2141 domain-containing protein [Caulobacterales bacterium]|nr:DUF2141 domain-containing protein [Caulobacterales bacterium]